MNKTTIINWLPFPSKEIPTNWENDLWLEPEPVVKRISQLRNNEVEYLKCPAFLDYYKNTFLFRSPIDFKVKTEGTALSLESSYICLMRSKINSVFKTVVVDLQTLFVTEESVILEQLPASMEPELGNFRIIPGEFNIGKWFRPVTFSIELSADTLEIKRGDPLFYFRFRTSDNSKVILNRIEETTNIRNAVNKCVMLKYESPANKMQENYEYTQLKGICPFKH